MHRPTRRSRVRRRGSPAIASIGALGVDATDVSLRPDPLEKLGHVEPWSAADIEYSLAGRRGERILDEAPAPQRIASAVDHLEGLRSVLVELELGHVPKYPINIAAWRKREPSS